jgi:IclR family acetate operon transcriptional repressor
LTTLQKHRFVRFDTAATSWQVGVQAFIVGNAFARNRDIATTARPYMRQLMEASGETVNLYVMSDGRVMCRAQIESRQMMRAIARPGGRARMHAAAVGKAILAYLPASEVKEITARHGLDRLTRKTLVTKTALNADLKRTSDRGYAIDDEENAVGMRCVAAPIFDQQSMPIAGLSLSGPSTRITDDKLAKLGAMIVHAARATTIEIGGDPLT